MATPVVKAGTTPVLNQSQVKPTRSVIHYKPAFIKRLLVPNGMLSKTEYRLLSITMGVIAIAVWSTVKIPLVPAPIEILRELHRLWFQEGLMWHTERSLILNVETLAMSTGIALIISYSYTIALFRPIVYVIAKCRFLSLAGLFVFLLGIFGYGSTLQKLILIIVEVPYFVNSMVYVIESILKLKYDHARTQGMNEYKVTREVVILNTIPAAWDVLRGNAAMGWTALTLVEGISRSSGGLGALLLNEDKHHNLEALAAIMLYMIVIGALVDAAIYGLKKATCHYASIKLERK